MKIKEIEVKNIMTKSKLPASDYAVNPYVGCPHKCRYCYACFMKRFTNHEEPWGDFIDIKNFPKIKNPHKYDDKTIFIGSVTDAYNPLEKKYKKTRELLEQLIDTEADVVISTKSNLILRDIDLLKQFKNITVAFSINTLDENFRKDMDKASSIEKRIRTMQELHKEGIYTVTFISPIFPAITDVQKIMETTKDSCDMFWLENLNLRGAYKSDIMSYIKRNFPQYYSLYEEIYVKGNKAYWIDLSREIEKYSKDNAIPTINYFYHDLIRKH